MDNQAIVNAIAERLKALREKRCPQSTCGLAYGEGICLACNGTGVITDPRYQAAWELVTVFRAKAWHPDYQAEIADCAVVGLLEGVVRKVHSPKLYAFLVNWKRGDNPIPEEWATKWFMENILPFHWPDPDDAQGLGKALLEALK